MAIKRFKANSDNTITNAFKSNLTQRGLNANMGASDVLETFSIYGQASSGSTELERILIKFPITEIITERTAGTIPDSGSVSFYLRMYNAKTDRTVPRNLGLSIYAVSRSWQEGTGLDMDEYKDVVTQGDIGSTWISASSTEAWTRMGGDYHTSPVYNQSFTLGTEDLSVDVTPLVEEWIVGTKTNYGFGVHLTGTQESYYSASTDSTSSGQLVNLTGSQTTYYTKKFFGRGSEFFFKRPTIEARWDSAIKDDRGNFYASSSLLPASVNTRTLYLHNVIGGKLYNIPAVGTGEIYLKTYTSSSGGSQIGTTVTGGYVSLGVYSASFTLDTTASTVYDRWYSSGFADSYYTGTIGIKTHDVSGYNPYSTYVPSLTNLKPIYYPHETARFRFYVRLKDWSPNLYTVANTINDTLIIESASYQIHRIIDDLKIIPFDTGSTRSTETSFDVSGNYFDLSMNLFDPGYSYGIRLAFYNESVSSYVEQPYEWKFRVDNLETQ